MAHPLLSFQAVSKIFPPDIVALQEITFEMQRGEFISIVGRSGAGKTTLLKVLLGEELPTSGRVFFEKKEIHRLSFAELAHVRRKIGVVFQDYRLLPSKTLRENVAYVLELTDLPDKKIEEEVRHVLELVELQDRAHHFPHELSGGENQRAAIARALVHRPDVLLADEPTGNLDPYHTKDILELLKKIHKLGTSVILATHNKNIVNSLEQRVITLQEGKIIRDEKRGKFAL